MPRRNNSSGRSGGRRRSGPRPSGRNPEIDWERIDAQAKGKDEPEERQPEPEPEPEPAPKPHNQFTRNIKGFSPQALELLLSGRFSAVEEEGIIPVTFIGVTSKLAKEMPYKNTVILRTDRDYDLVLSGAVDKKSVREIGNGTGASGDDISRLHIPQVGSHNSDRRLNVVLGREPFDFDVEKLGAEIAASELVLSPVASINGQEVTPDSMSWEISGMWNRAQPTY